MKIAILVLRFPPIWLAGTEIATLNLARCLARKGHEVHVITSCDKGLPKESFEQGFCVHRICMSRIKFPGRGIIFSAKTLSVLIRLRPEIIHAQGIGMGITCFLAKKFIKTPYIIWEQGDIYLPWRFKKPYSKMVLKNAGAVIALTKDMKEIMKRIFGRDIYIIPNGINLDAFKRPSIKSVPNLKSKDYEKVILFIGRLHPVKGVRYLIQAINILSAEGMVGVKLVIVGEGEERRSLEDYVKQLHLKEQVIFVGKIPNKKVPDYMAIADVFVLPSLSEGLPLVILEAMASGLPIIATRIGGLPEIIENGNNGFLVQPKNPKEIAEKLKLLLYNRELVEKMSQNNKKKAMNYSWEKIVYQLEEIYRRVIFR